MSFPAIIIADTQHSFLGLPSRIADELLDRTILDITLTRLASIPEIDQIIIVHPESQAPQSLITTSIDKPLYYFPHNHTPNVTHRNWQSGRKWALTAWRGGLGWSSIFDESLPAKPLADALAHYKQDAAFIVRADWPLFDLQSASQLITRHREAPEALRFCFTQSPPGLAGYIASQSTFQQFTDHNASFGQILGYSHSQPMLDPISRDANIAIPPAVRDCNRRFVYDTARSVALVNQLASHLGKSLISATNLQIATAANEIETSNPLLHYQSLPQQITLELTPNRSLDGPLTVQHYITPDREPITIDHAHKVIKQIAVDPNNDIVLTFAGVGDSLLHPQYKEIIIAAHDAGVLGIALETDLHINNPDQLASLHDLPIDLLITNLNADSEQAYQRVMNSSDYNTPFFNIESLLNTRLQRQRDFNPAFIPWIIPSFLKTKLNLEDMDSFFARWMYHAKHALIRPFQTAIGKLPDLSPVPMQPPKRKPCSQLANRLTILSDGSVLQCDQDITAQSPLGNMSQQPLLELWQSQFTIYASHTQHCFDCNKLCASCSEWFRP
ncbi:hypothetical protein KS4_35130 [Poriferisphaera corsica]|uniref:4Fe4S-binding SPASM domain-containing protein n=1 Tax=Poriferisphaera corsica TaxID=2528020 RepID=A0A517YYY1_9BACT|nr:radical SAM/SPASM domain-containing protein [Poriferisphaera corsica]QDU35432.1 hypothetical protein KS4_35130 [Poriferisphaera corsica]